MFGIERTRSDDRDALLCSSLDSLMP